MTFLTLLFGLGASCWGAALREEHAAPQVEQSWVHSSLILFARTGGGKTGAVRFLLAQYAGRGVPCLTTAYYTIKSAAKQPMPPLMFCAGAA